MKSNLEPYLSSTRAQTWSIKVDSHDKTEDGHEARALLAEVIGELRGIGRC